MASSKNSVADAYLEMTRRETTAKIRRRTRKASIGSGFINLPNKCEDASKYLNENRKPNPEAKQIVAMLKASERRIMKMIGFKKRATGR